MKRLESLFINYPKQKEKIMERIKTMPAKHLLQAFETYELEKMWYHSVAAKMPFGGYFLRKSLRKHFRRINANV